MQHAHTIDYIVAADSRKTEGKETRELNATTSTDRIETVCSFFNVCCVCAIVMVWPVRKRMAQNQRESVWSTINSSIHQSLLFAAAHLRCVRDSATLRCNLFEIPPFFDTLGRLKSLNVSFFSFACFFLFIARCIQVEDANSGIVGRKKATFARPTTIEMWRRHRTAAKLTIDQQKKLLGCCRKALIINK